MVKVNDGRIAERRVGVGHVVVLVDGEQRVGPVGVRVGLRVGEQQVRLSQVVHVEARDVDQDLGDIMTQGNELESVQQSHFGS